MSATYRLPDGLPLPRGCLARLRTAGWTQEDLDALVALLVPPEYIAHGLTGSTRMVLDILKADFFPDPAPVHVLRWVAVQRDQFVDWVLENSTSKDENIMRSWYALLGDRGPLAVAAGCTLDELDPDHLPGEDTLRMMAALRGHENLP